MAKLITILAASIGGGVVLGAGIRLVERAAGRDEQKGGGLSNRSSANRLAAEARSVAAMENAVSVLNSRLHAQQADLTAMRAQLAEGDPETVHLNRRGERLLAELRGWVEEDIRQQFTAAEAKLQASIESTGKHMLDAIVEGVQTQVMGRISKLEEEVAGQSAAVAELRECSFKTEENMQKLLEGIDRLVGTQARAAIQAEELPVPDSAARGDGAGPEQDAATNSGSAALDTRREENPDFRRWRLSR